MLLNNLFQIVVSDNSFAMILDAAREFIPITFYAIMELASNHFQYYQIIYSMQVLTQ